MPFNSAQGDERYDNTAHVVIPTKSQGLYPQYTVEEGYTPFTRPEMQYKPLQKPIPQYIQSGNREDMPYYNSTELMIINGGIEKDLIDYYRTNPEFAQEVLEGGGVKKFFRNIKRGANKAFNQAGNEIKKVAYQAGDEIKRSATDKDGFIRQAISSTADVALPAIGSTLGTAIGTYMGNPVMGEMVGNVVGRTGRQVLKTQTGYGVKSGGGGVGIYKGGSTSTTQKLVQSEINKAINQYLPEGKTVMGKGMADVANKPAPKALKNNKSREDRNIIVKRIMAERGIKSMPEASKIVKAEGLYKPLK